MIVRSGYPSNSYRLLIPIVMVYVSLMLVTIAVAYKLVQIWNINFVASTLALPLWLMVENIITEVYGYKIVRKAIWSALLCEFLFVFLCFCLIHLPSPSYWQAQTNYDYVFSKLPRVFVGSCLAIICGAFINAYMISKWKILTAGKMFLLRALGASAIGELVFSIITVSCNYLGVFEWHHVLELMVASYGFKILATLIFIIPTNIIAIFVKDYEGIDVYDINTDFNPFKI